MGERVGPALSNIGEQVSFHHHYINIIIFITSPSQQYVTLIINGHVLLVGDQPGRPSGSCAERHWRQGTYDQLLQLLRRLYMFIDQKTLKVFFFVHFKINIQMFLRFPLSMSN